jgi:hypothetical protein
VTVLPGPLVLDLIAALVQSGAPPPSALAAVGAALQAVGDSRGGDLLRASGRVSRPRSAGSVGPLGAGLAVGPGSAVDMGLGVEPGSAVGLWVGSGSVPGPGLGMATGSVLRPVSVMGLAPAGAESATEGRAGQRAGPDRLTEVVEEALGLAARSGLPPTALIRRSATEERRRQAAAQLRAVRRLEVLLVIPAGLCLLPAFVLLGIVPVVLDLILG